MSAWLCGTRQSGCAVSDLYWLVPAFFATALCYAAAGFGGGSTYLALLALTGLAVGELRFTALLCNLIVTAGTCWLAWRSDLLRWRLLLPLVAASVPLAFVGGTIELARDPFLAVLALVLLLAGGLMWWRSFQMGVAAGAEQTDEGRQSMGWKGAGLLGGSLGLGSGILGIGGGILLSPFLFLRSTLSAREVAATTACFIFLNSLSGLAGQWLSGGRPPWPLAAYLLAAVLLGGIIGSRLALRRLPAITLRRLAATLILLVAIRILLTIW